MRRKNIDWDDILSDIENRTQKRKDIIINSRELTLDDKTGNLVGMNDRFQTVDFPMNGWAQGQLFNKLNMPGKYFKERMNEGKFDLVKDHIDYNKKRLDEKEFMIRTIKDKSEDSFIYDNNIVRAVLSDRFSPFDNDQLTEVLNDALTSNQYKYEIVEYQNDDLTASFRITFPDTEKDLGKKIKRGDILKSAIMVINSEVGKSGIYIMPVVYRVVCSNGLTVWKSIGGRGDFYRKHVGLDKQEVYSFSRTAIEKAMSKAYSAMEKIEELQSRPVSDPEKKIKQLLSNNKIPKRLHQPVIDTYNEYWLGDNSMYGIMNSITRVARDLNQDDKRDLEIVAGNITMAA